MISLRFKTVALFLYFRRIDICFPTLYVISYEKNHLPSSFFSVLTLLIKTVRSNISSTWHTPLYFYFSFIFPIMYSRTYVKRTMQQTSSYSILSFTSPPAASINPYEGKSRPVTVISSPVPVPISPTT